MLRLPQLCSQFLPLIPQLANQLLQLVLLLLQRMHLFLPLFELVVIGGGLLLLQLLESAGFALHLHLSRTQVVLQGVLFRQPQLHLAGQVGFQFGEGLLQLLVEGVELAVVGLQGLLCLFETGEGESDRQALLLQLFALGRFLFADVPFVLGLAVQRVETVLEVCELPLVVQPLLVEIFLRFGLQLLSALHFFLQSAFPAAGLLHLSPELSLGLLPHAQLFLHCGELGQLLLGLGKLLLGVGELVVEEFGLGSQVGGFFFGVGELLGEGVGEFLLRLQLGQLQSERGYGGCHLFMFGCGLLQLSFHMFPQLLLLLQILVVFLPLLFDLLQLEGLEPRSFFLLPQLLLRLLHFPLHFGQLLLVLLKVQFCLLQLELQFLLHLRQRCLCLFQQCPLLLLTLQLPLQFLNGLLPADGFLGPQLHFLGEQLQLVFLLLVGLAELQDFLQQGLPLLGGAVDVGLELRVGGCLVVEGLLELCQLGSVVVSVLHEFSLGEFVLRESCLLLPHCDAQSRLLLAGGCHLSLDPLPPLLPFCPLVQQLCPFFLQLCLFLLQMQLLFPQLAALLCLFGSY